MIFCTWGTTQTPWLGEGLADADDATVVQAARAADRILLTLDKGIASLLQYPVHEHGGVVLFRRMDRAGAPSCRL